MLRVRPRMVATVALATCLAGCTGGGEAPTPATASPSATSSTGVPSTTAGPSPSASAAPPPTPSPVPATVEVGLGEVRLRADDDSFLASDVRGDCLVAGDTLPGDDTGSALGDDVEFFVAVDNYLGPFGEPSAPRPIVLTVDGSDGVATVDLFGWPRSSPWWSSQVESATLSAPRVQDGVTTATLDVAATLDPAEPQALQVPVPRPPAGGGSSGATGASPGSSSNADGSRTVVRPVAPPRERRPLPVRGEASPGPTATPSGPGPTEPSASEPSAPEPTPGVPTRTPASPTPTPAVTPSPAPSPSPAPVRAIDLTLTLTCTTLH